MIKQLRNKKGFVFTLDAVIGLIIVMGAFVFASSVLTAKSQSPFLAYEQLHYDAQDTMEVMNKMETLDTIGGYWTAANCTQPSNAPECTNASNIAQTTLGQIMPLNVGYRLSFENNTIYENSDYVNETNASRISIASRVASGFTKGRQKTGYVARAFATKINNRTTTRVIPFHVSGGGWSAKEFELRKNFTLPNDTVIKSAVLYVSIRYGSKQASPEFKELKVNGNQKKNDITWLYTQKEDAYESTATYGSVDVAPVLQAGVNAVSLRIGAPHAVSHLLPGMFLVVTFNSNQTFVDIGNVQHKEFFDYMKGDNGVWAIIPYVVPKNATGVTAKLHLEGESIYNAPNEKGLYNHSDVEIYVNSDNPVFNDTAPNATPSYNLDLTSYSKEGTNVISIYMNSYGDNGWGQQEAIISPKSFVEVNYTTAEKKYGYGEIDITRVVGFGGFADNPKNTTFSIPAEVESIFEVYVNIAQSFITMDNVSAWYPGKQESLAFKSPTLKAVPTRVYIDPDKFKTNSTNNLKVTDYNTSGDVVLIDKILSYSNVEYTFLARVAVSYGDVFDYQDDALSDAIDRLKTRAEVLGVDLGSVEIANESLATGGVPTLWGPSRFTFEVWQ